MFAKTLETITAEPDPATIQRSAGRIRMSWSSAERRKRLRRGQEKRSELLRLLLAAKATQETEDLCRRVG
jgi:hypothetical protein